MLGSSVVVEYLPGRKLPSIMENIAELRRKCQGWSYRLLRPVSFLNVGYRHTQFLYVGAEDLNSALHTCEDVLLTTEPSSQHYRLL